MKKIKTNNRKIKLGCTNCFKSNHIVFNFAYLTYKDDFREEEKHTLVDRMFEVSSVTYLELMRWDKYKGIEEERLDIRKEIPKSFVNDIEEFDGKYTIMRLYKNNFPTPRKDNRKIGK